MATLFPSNPSSKKVTLASWNVNSVRARLPVLQAFIEKEQPDILCLQETKCLDEAFPHDVLSDYGYNIAHCGQKTFNGVAILSKFPMEDIVKGIPDFEDEHSRFIQVGIALDGEYFTVASVYVPNGQEVGSDKYEYKLRFLDSLKAHAKTLFDAQEKVIFAGDFNIAPTDKDVYDPQSWHEAILCSTKERQAFFEILNIGYTDIFSYEAMPSFTWWDYRGGSFEKNHGLRIDHVLASPFACDRIAPQRIHKDIRAMDKTSDHAPISISIDL